MSLSNSASVFNAGVWAIIIKASEQIKGLILIHFDGFTFVSLRLTTYEAGTILTWDGDTKVYQVGVSY